MCIHMYLYTPTNTYPIRKLNKHACTYMPTNVQLHQKYLQISRVPLFVVLVHREIPTKRAIIDLSSCTWTYSGSWDNMTVCYQAKKMPQALYLWKEYFCQEVVCIGVAHDKIYHLVVLLAIWVSLYVFWVWLSHRPERCFRSMGLVVSWDHSCLTAATA